MLEEAELRGEGVASEGGVDKGWSERPSDQQLSCCSIERNFGQVKMAGL